MAAACALLTLSAATRSVVERLARLLLTLSELEGRETETGTLIDRTFTHEELANFVGATRQWVTKTLEKFCSEGTLRISNKKIRIRIGIFHTKP